MSTTDLPPIVYVTPKESKKEDPPRLESFHEATKPVILCGQFFGLIPCENILQENENKIEFQWKSAKTIYALVFLLLGTIESIVGMRRLIRLGFNIHFVENLLFLATGMVKAFLMFRLGRRWKDIMVKFRSCESVFLYPPYSFKGIQLKTKLRFIAFLIISLIFLEHIFFLTKAIEENKIQLTNCTPISNDFWQNFLWRNRPHLIFNFPYSPFELPLYEWVNLLQAFAWSFADVVILILALGLQFRFKQFNLRFKTISKDEKLMTNLNFWRMRTDLFKLIDLVHFVDDHIASLVFVSLGHNMFVVMVKIFSALNSDRLFPLDEIYFWCYLFFLLVRVYYTLFSCASIHESATKPLNCIGSIPSHLWTVDLTRIRDTILTEADTLTLSGKGFFYISRTMMLSFVGTIVTFELVLLDQIKEEEPSLCKAIAF